MRTLWSLCAILSWQLKAVLRAPLPNCSAFLSAPNLAQQQQRRDGAVRPQGNPRGSVCAGKDLEGLKVQEKRGLAPRVLGGWGCSSGGHFSEVMNLKRAHPLGWGHSASCPERPPPALFISALFCTSQFNDTHDFRSGRTTSAPRDVKILIAALSAWQPFQNAPASLLWEQPCITALSEPCLPPPASCCPSVLAAVLGRAGFGAPAASGRGSVGL